MNFFCKLNAPRPTFAADMTADEAALMRQHGTYWRQGIANGSVIAFGLVGDPAGAYGIAIVDFPNPADARAFTDSDPVILASRGFSYDVLPMPMGVVRA